MASLTIKYGDNVLSQDGGTITKTLKTGGRQCEHNFIVSMEEEASVVSYRYFTINVAENQSGRWYKAIESDADIAAHINDDTFGIAYNCLSPIKAYTSVRGGIYTNAPMGWYAEDGSQSMYGYYMRTASSGLGGNARLTNKPTVKTTAVGAVYVGADGSIEIYGSSSYPLRAGTYQIIVWW